MHPPLYTKPFYIFFLMLPTGISNGFVTVALPFLLTRNNFPVGVTAGVIAIGVSANLLRFLWGPVVDISLSLRKWFWISLTTSIITLMLLCITPFTIEGTILLSVIVFISQVAGTFMVLPVNGFMARSIEENKKGKASGWYQAGSLAGSGLGGGIGLWLATDYSPGIAGFVLCAMSVLFAMVILLIRDIPHAHEKTMIQELRVIGNDVFAMLKIPLALFVIILLIMPIGTGAAANLWSAISLDWHTYANTVILITGLLSGLVSAIGCIAGGFIADRWGVWVAYLGSGVICALCTLIMALLPFQPWVYIAGVLAYAFSMGLIYAAFTAVILFAIGKKHVATKFSLLASLGNLPVVYMTTFNGWAHDEFNSRYMLIAEALIGILFVIIFYFILKRMIYKNLIPAVAEG